MTHSDATLPTVLIARAHLRNLLGLEGVTIVGLYDAAPGKAAETLATVLDIRSQVNSFGDRGLLGLAVDSDFATNRYVYLLYTRELNPALPDSSAPMASRLTRIVLNADSTVANPGSPETVLLGSYAAGVCPTAANDVDCIPSDGTSHSIGTVRASSTILSACCAVEVQIFLPLTM